MCHGVREVNRSTDRGDAMAIHHQALENLDSGRA
jgi:hypothetical protein